MTFDLQQLQKRFQPRSVLAITIESGRIIASLTQKDGILPPLFLDISADALIGDPAQAGKAFAEKLQAAGIRERRCVLCIPPSWTLTASADLPEVSPEDLRGYFELRAEREFSTSELRLAFTPYSLPDGSQRATLAALPTKQMEAVEAFLLNAGCHLVSLSVALYGCLAKAESTLHLLVNRDSTDAVITCGGGVAALRTLTGSATSPSFAREVRITLGRLPEAVRQSVKHARIYGSQESGLRAILEYAGFDSIVEETGGAPNPAVESAERFLNEAPVPFEFLVPEPSRWPAALDRLNTKRGRQIAAGALALVVLPMLLFTIQSYRESHLTAEWDGMKNNVAELDVIQQKIRQFRPWFEPAPQKLQALETLIAAFPERGEIWTRSVQITNYMEKNEAAMPGGAVKTTFSGFARNNALQGLQERLPKQPGVSLMRLQQTRGNNPTQFTLTFRWEPKHD